MPAPIQQRKLLSLPIQPAVRAARSAAELYQYRSGGRVKALLRSCWRRGSCAADPQSFDALNGPCHCRVVPRGQEIP